MRRLCTATPPVSPCLIHCAAFLVSWNFALHLSGRLDAAAGCSGRRAAGGRAKCAACIPVPLPASYHAGLVLHCSPCPRSPAAPSQARHDRPSGAEREAGWVTTAAAAAPRGRLPSRRHATHLTHAAPPHTQYPRGTLPEVGRGGSG